MQCSFICSDHHKLLLTTIYHFWWPYTTFSGDILLLATIYYFRQLSAAMYYFWRLCTTFDGYILLLALPDCDFVRIQDFPVISRIWGLKARLEFSINLLALIFFYFYWSSMFSSINFNLPSWKCCFIRNTQMLKM